MRFATIIAAAFAVVSGVSANTYKNETEYTTTEVVTEYTTYCPYPTTIIEGTHTYTVTEATTLTITDCPCTRTKTYTTVTSTLCYGECQPTSISPNQPPPSHPPPTYPSVNTTYVHPPPSYPTTNNTISPVPESEGGAVSNKATIAGGALAALVGVAVYLL